VQTEGGTPLLTEVTRLITDALSRGVPEASLLSAIRNALSSPLVTMKKREPTVFLSYAHADSGVVQRVAEGLAADGIRVLQDKWIEAGATWRQEIERELSAADVVAFFISPHSVKTSFASKELQIALRQRVKGEGGAAIVPIVLEDADVPPLLRGFPWIDLRGGEIEKGIKELVDAIRHSSPSRLLAMAQGDLDALFNARAAGPIPDGETKGTLIISPGTPYSEAIAECIKTFAWKGKEFDANNGFLLTKIIEFGVKAILARIYKGPSWFDGKECIVLDYSQTSVAASHIRDEIRLVNDGFYLGKFYRDSRPLVDFCLDFRRTGTAERVRDATDEV
jgi:hypothetical protein